MCLEYTLPVGNPDPERILPLLLPDAQEGDRGFNLGPLANGWMSATGGGRYGTTASTCSTGTGTTFSASLTLVWPRFRPATARSRS
jgi:hypothetical protein